MTIANVDINFLGQEAKMSLRASFCHKSGSIDFAQLKQGEEHHLQDDRFLFVSQFLVR